ncbi:cellulase family glycosylhydrolase [uncultured Algibacter sp.]|uniref:GH39 family glycosyl hydrolase n=1 Tax=uncultured Algibacter sp. TaxID=298659 RepID=UPI00261C592F|nr:cellulase family glycosylhydrolase [uncultured Algibacter sp.]
MKNITFYIIILLIFATSCAQKTVTPVVNNNATPNAVATINVDVSQPAYYPLLKGKASLFQEGVPKIKGLKKLGVKKAMKPLSDLKIRSFRALVNQNGDIISKNEIQKNKDNINYINELHKNNTLPILTLYQTPLVFRNDKTNKFPESKREIPNNIKAYSKSIGKYVKLHKNMHPLLWEVWNEPQNNKFLNTNNGNQIETYNTIYEHVAPSIRLADPDALIVGPAMANSEKYIQEFSSEFIQNVKTKNLPLDYFSIHSYGRFSNVKRNKKQPNKQRPADRVKWIVETTRRNLSDDFQTVPLVFTEYEHYATGKEVGKSDSFHYNREETTGAVKFLSDLNYFIEQTDIPFVTWNRYLHHEHMIYGGLIDTKLKKRPIYHAFYLYGKMPTERKSLVIKNKPNGLHGFASSDEHGTGVLLWNDTNKKKSTPITLSLEGLSLKQGDLYLYRIDANHSSYQEKSSTDALVKEKLTATSTILELDIPSPGILYLEFKPKTEQTDLTTPFNADYIRSWQWTGRTEEGDISGDYGDFDWRTWTARMGIKEDLGKGLCGVTLDNVPNTIQVKYNAYNLDIQKTKDALLGMKIDYMIDGKSIKSIILHNGTFNKNRATAFPWGDKNPIADESINMGSKIGNNQLWSLPINTYAPLKWQSNKTRRVMLSFCMQDTGKESQAVVKLFADK